MFMDGGIALNYMRITDEIESIILRSNGLARMTAAQLKSYIGTLRKEVRYAFWLMRFLLESHPLVQ